MPINKDLPTNAEVKIAFLRWYNAQDLTYGSAVRSFYKATGLRSFLDGPGYHLTPEQAKRIKQFAGEHGAAMVKAYLARQ